MADHDEFGKYDESMETIPDPETLLNQRRINFCEAVLRGESQVDAYYAAGYQNKDRRSAAVEASRLARDPRIVAYLQKRREEIKAQTNITADRVLKEIARIGFSDIRDLMSWNEQGVMFIPSAHLNDDQAATISSVRSKRRVRTMEDGATEETVEVELKTHSKIEALEKLSKHLGLYQADRVNDADREANLLATVLWRYVMARHVHDGTPVAEALSYAERNPQEVEEWGIEVKLLPERTATKS